MISVVKITPPSKHQNRTQLVLLSFRVQPLNWQSFTDIGEMTCSTTAWCRPVDTLWKRYLSVFSFSFVYFLIYSLSNSFLIFFFYHFILLILCFFSTDDINHSKGSKQKKKKRNKEKKKKRRAKKKAQKKSETSKGKSQRFLILEKIIVMNEKLFKVRLMLENQGKWRETCSTCFDEW